MAKFQATQGRGGPAPMVSLPRAQVHPIRELIQRGLLAAVLLGLSTLFVWLDRDSYIDNTQHDGVSVVDALYYSTVTMTTTGYGDITPAAPHARLLNALVITPMRVGFLVLLVGTTIEVLANEGSRTIRDLQWRKKMRQHVVIIGYGTKGRSAVNTLRSNGTPVDKIVVIDNSAQCIGDANLDGLAAFQGDATRRDLLRRAEISKAREVIISLDRDDTAILTTLTVRQLNPNAGIVVSVREQDNVPLVRQSGATSVVTSAATVGRLMGLSAIGPDLGALIQDMLTSGTGLEVTQRQATAEEVGGDPARIAGERIIGVVRNGTLRRFYDPTAARIEVGDDLIVVRRGNANLEGLRDHGA
ncbi:MAG: potassium channel family protein [Arachnia sp.]